MPPLLLFRSDSPLACCEPAPRETPVSRSCEPPASVRTAGSASLPSREQTVGAGAFSASELPPVIPSSSLCAPLRVLQQLASPSWLHRRPVLPSRFASPATVSVSPPLPVVPASRPQESAHEPFAPKFARRPPALPAPWAPTSRSPSAPTSPQPQGLSPAQRTASAAGSNEASPARRGGPQPALRLLHWNLANSPGIRLVPVALLRLFSGTALRPVQDRGKVFGRARGVRGRTAKSSMCRAGVKSRVPQSSQSEDSQSHSAFRTAQRLFHSGTRGKTATALTPYSAALPRSR